MTCDHPPLPPLPLNETTADPNIPNDAYQCATIAVRLIAQANAQAESLNEDIRIMMATAKDLGYDLADSYEWDPDTFLPTRGTGLSLVAKV